MRSGKRPVYCWDANMFFRLIAGRQKGPPLFDAIYEVARQVTENTAILVTSSVVRTELTITKMKPQELKIFDGIMHRRNVIEQAYDSRIADQASAIQDELKKVGRQLNFYDLAYVTTGVLSDADELHTTDGPMLGCDGHPVLRGMRILTPVARQPRLF